MLYKSGLFMQNKANLQTEHKCTSAYEQKKYGILSCGAFRKNKPNSKPIIKQKTEDRRQDKEACPAKPCRFGEAGTERQRTDDRIQILDTWCWIMDNLDMMDFFTICVNSCLTREIGKADHRDTRKKISHAVNISRVEFVVIIFPRVIRDSQFYVYCPQSLISGYP